METKLMNDLEGLDDAQTRESLEAFEVRARGVQHEPFQRETGTCGRPHPHPTRCGSGAILGHRVPFDVGDATGTPTDEAPLTELALEFPILPGMTDRVERFAAELCGSRSEDFSRSQRTLGVRKERWFLNRTTRGDSVIVYIEAENVFRTLALLVASKDPVDLWLKEEVRQFTGIDFSTSPSIALPKPLLRYPS